MNRWDSQTTILLGSIVAALVVGYFLLAPLLGTYHDHRLARAARTIEVDNLKAHQAALDRLETELRLNAAAANRLSLAVPAETSPADLVAQIAALASESGLSLTTIQPARGGSTTTAETAVTISVTGSFSAIVALAEKLEGNLRPAHIRSLNVVENSSADAAGVLSATLEVAFRVGGGAQ